MGTDESVLMSGDRLPPTVTVTFSSTVSSSDWALQT